MSKEEKYQNIKQEFINAGASDELMDYLEKLKPYLFIEQKKQDSNANIPTHLEEMIQNEYNPTGWSVQIQDEMSLLQDAARFGVKIALEEQQKEMSTLKTILYSCFDIIINCNDFFRYASSYGQKIDIDDLPWITPVVDKYGYDGLYACVSYIAKCMPIEPHQTENFKADYKELEESNPKVRSEE